jgi:hypothetical protein
MKLKLTDDMNAAVLRIMGGDELRKLFEEAEAANDDLTCFAVQDEFKRRSCGDCDPCLGGRHDQCAIMGTANIPAETRASRSLQPIVGKSGGGQ